MKNSQKHKFFKLAMFLFAITGMVAFHACSSDDDPEPEAPVASFQYEISEDNFMEVIFENFSQNATSYEWDFDDGETSTEQNPSHIYAEPGVYDVTLTAMNDHGDSHSFTETISIDDPDQLLTLLAGTEQKEWKLYRVGTSMGIGPDKEDARDWWALHNDGSRPCVYFHTFTFHRDGDFVFDDQGVFWGEDAIFDGTDVHGTCFEAIPENMVNMNGDDVSAFLGGTHQFELDAASSMVTLNGHGAWMGMPQMTPTGQSPVPSDTNAFKIESIEEHGDYDLMIISYTHDDEGHYWDFSYAHYHNPDAEPEVIEEEEEIDPLEELTPTEMFNTFASESEDDVQILVPTESTVELTVGVEDPADPDATLVGEYHRVAELFQELQFATEYYIQFDNFTTVSLDVYIPSTNDFSGELTTEIGIVIANNHDTPEWWNHHLQYDVDPDDVVLDEWQTWTFQLDQPTSGPGIDDGTPHERDDLNFFAITIGGAGHDEEGIFYIRDFIFE